MPNQDFDCLNENLGYDATNSWSGYNYQGKTAIYIALKKINSLYSSNNGTAIPTYFLELEWLEDFSIIYRVDGKMNYESIHQVKARKDTKISSYAQALTLLLKKIENHSEIGQAYLHTINIIDYPDGQWETALNDVFTANNTLQDLIAEVEQYINDKHKLKDLTERITKPGGPTNFILSLKNEYKKKYPGMKLTKDKINEALALLKESLQEDLEYCKKGISQSSLQKIKLYSYDNQTTSKEYCPLDKIEELIKNEILEYWRRNPAYLWKISDSNLLQDIYLYLLGEIDKHIVYRHQNYGSNPIRHISLSVFEDVLNSDEPATRCEEYYLYITKHNVLSYCNAYHERCLRMYKEDGINAPCDFCQIHSAIERIEMLTFPELKELIRVSNPDVQAKHDINSLAQYCTEGKYNNPFLRGLMVIKQPYEPERLPISFMSKDKQLHLLTTLKDDDAPRPIQAICQKILKNRELPEIFMDYDVLLSKDLKSSSVLNDAGDFLGDFEVEENNIYHFKKVKIQTVDDSLSILNI
ncbi:MAG: hypothetical protein PWP27_2615 [Clostridiales bacterium]|nr:hypothetical protein [Clostridiales bacterium]